MGKEVIFTNTSDPGIPPAIESEWDFGDGVTHIIGATESATHMYAETGTYTVVLTLCNSVGCDTFTRDVDVMPWAILLPIILKN